MKKLISIKQKIDNSPVCTIKINNNDLDIIISPKEGNEDILQYLEKNKGDLKSHEFRQRTGGMTEDGSLWDGIKTITIKDEQFIDYLKFMLEGTNETLLNSKYIFDIEEE